MENNNQERLIIYLIYHVVSTLLLVRTDKDVYSLYKSFHLDPFIRKVAHISAIQLR